MVCIYENGVIDVITPRSEWKIIVNGQLHKIFLYHKNSRPCYHDTSMIPSYHSQATRSNTILGYLQYIMGHDEYRRHHPIAEKKKEKPAPSKGTKRYKKAVKRQRALERRTQIRSVYHMIDILMEQEVQ